MAIALSHNPLYGAFGNFFSALKNDGKINEEHQKELASLIGNTPLHVLLADDDEDDREFFKEAVQAVAPSVKVTTTNDGEEMINLLNETQKDLPDLIFLDLNMPCKNGFECLEELKNNEKLKNIPVLIYSTTANIEQVDHTYKKGANLYIQKPHSFDGIKNMLKKIFAFNIEDLFPQPQREKFVLR
ncbi:MAG: response regulator [Bacteroidota bacterium]